MNHLDTFIRQRARRVVDPMNPDALIDDWSTTDDIEIDGYFEQDSSNEQIDPVRNQAITIVTLVIPNPDADVQRGDRITQGPRTWTVQGYPYAPKNPFTGWRPGLFIRMKESVG